MFLFDEPLSNLDADLRAQMRVEIARLRDALKTAMIYVTHDQVEAMTLADRIVILNNGRVEQEGPPLDLYEKPANRFVAGFLGQPKMNFLPALAIATGTAVELRLAGEGPAVISRAPSSGLIPGETVELGIRPDAIALADAGGLPATVVLVERLGGSSLLHARVEGLGNLVTAELPGTFQASPGAPVRLAMPINGIFARTRNKTDRGRGYAYVWLTHGVSDDNPTAHDGAITDRIGSEAARKRAPLHSNPT